MKKTNFTLFHFEKTLARRFKFLALSMVFTILFLGAGNSVFAQGITPTGAAGSEYAELFKNYDFIDDKNEAYSILYAAVIELQGNGMPNGGIAEANHTATVFFMKAAASKIQNNTTVIDALSESYVELLGYAANFKGNINVDEEAIAIEVANLLD
jgi:hypothetical protein